MELCQRQYTQSLKHFPHSKILLNICQLLNSSVCVLRGYDLVGFSALDVLNCVCVCVCVLEERQTPPLDKPVKFLCEQSEGLCALNGLLAHSFCKSRCKNWISFLK